MREDLLVDCLLPHAVAWIMQVKGVVQIFFPLFMDR
jgi:hypothetical protein